MPHGTGKHDSGQTSTPTSGYVGKHSSGQTATDRTDAAKLLGRQPKGKHEK